MSQKSHLDQEELVPRAKPVLKLVGEWLGTLKFEKQGDFELCSEDPEVVLAQPLLSILFTLMKIKFPVDFKIARVSKTARLPARLSTPVTLIPGKVVGGTPTVAGLPFEVGWITYITEGVEFTPEVIFLLL
ncbi:hypothetical protein K469DRAFT_705125 [Zopfia rhizophila CBS 207.26]|uniref:Uncharacterized protein n=1 Tax=Zopfia rhizophila CBS 207.26 TaxID=1314779 RepID=A0A6A6EA41_9PEZI|nr:hypothetical protein K469DRAFT_705125 [Zopfia rhizophila CBS 207.26]